MNHLYILDPKKNINNMKGISNNIGKSLEEKRFFMHD